VTLDLISVGRGEIEPQFERVKRYSPVSDLNAEADVVHPIADNNNSIDNGEILLFLSGSESVARLEMFMFVPNKFISISTINEDQSIQQLSKITIIKLNSLIFFHNIKNRLTILLACFLI